MGRQGMIAGGAIIALAAAFLAGRYSRKSETVTVDRVVYQDREKVVTQIQVKEVKVADVQILTKWRTVTTRGNDGATTIVREVVKDSTSHAQNMTEAKKDDARDKYVLSDQRHSVTVTARPEGWMLAGSVGTRFGGWKPVYGGQVSKRLIGPITVGLSASTDGAGVIVGLTW